MGAEDRLGPQEVKVLHGLPVEEAIRYWDAFEERMKAEGRKDRAVRLLCKSDLYYLLVRVCGRVDMLPCVGRPGFVDNQFAFERCREVEGAPDGFLDLWARGHFKSSVITFGLTIQDILRNPETTIGIFSHTRPIAKAFLRQIMRELETNKTLHWAFPDVLWGEDIRQAQKWALAVDTPVLTTTGWCRHGELRAGDRIYGSDGAEITVLWNSGPMRAECRRVVFDDCELIASSDHLWPVVCRTDKARTSKIRVFRTDDCPIGDKARNYLPTPVIAIAQRDDVLPVEPYVLGLWLGDGTAGTNIISMHRDDEPELLAQFKALALEAYIHRRKPQDNFSMYGVRGLKEAINDLGCLKQKHIPQRYLLGSKPERLALLQGLMDSDGTCKKDGRHRAGGMCMFSNINENLADGAFFLASSLGLRPSRIRFAGEYGHDVHHVYFVGIKSMPPFRIKRKLARCKDERHKKARYLRAVEFAPSVPVNCIKVSAKDSLYLAGAGMVPTHNSEDDGLIVKRKSNPNEATVEAWGLVDGQPTSKHYRVLLYDDVVVAGSVTTPEMIAKVMVEMERSYNLGTTPGVKRAAGTRWHFNDAYRTLADRGTLRLREHPGRRGGVEEGEPVLWDEATHAEKRAEMGPYTYASQILLNPKADALQGFKREWLRNYTKTHGAKFNNYLLVDSANTKRKESDYTAMWVIGLGTDGNYYALDIVRDRLNLTERTERLFTLHRKWKPKQVRYERYGMMADIEHIKREQENQNYRFDVVEVAGVTSKDDRIRRLLPIFEQGKFYLPKSLHVTDWQKNTRDLVRDFVEEEYYPFPTCLHKDMLDALSRIAEPDLKLLWPKEEQLYAPPPMPQIQHSGTAWMA